MTRSRGFGACLLVVWGAWLFALQGWFASSPGLGAWTPDLGIVLLLALSSRAAPGRGWLVVLVVACTRIAFTADPPLAVLVGYTFAFGLADRLRRVIEIDRPLPRAALAGLLALLLGGYWSVARSIALVGGLDADPIGLLSAEPRVAGATALAALLFSPWLLLLPGISLAVRRPA